MSENVTLFPNVLQPAAALKTYAPAGVKFLEGQQVALDSIKEYFDGWFGRRQSAAQAALDAAKRISEAATPLDMAREYQDWLQGAMARMMADGEALQHQMTKAGTIVGAQFSSTAEAVKEATEAQRSEARHIG